MYGLVRYFLILFLSTTITGQEERIHPSSDYPALFATKNIQILFRIDDPSLQVLDKSTMDIGKFFDPCSKDDIRCLSTATENFLDKTCNGIPEYDIKAIDPLIIPELDIVADDEIGLLLKFTNVNVTGLKNLQIVDFKMDTAKNAVVLKTKAALNIVSDLNIKLTKKNKSHDLHYTATATALGSSTYNYSLVKKKGVKYFEVGPETNACEIIGEPNVFIGEELQYALNNEKDAMQLKSRYDKNKAHLRKQTICKIVLTAYTVVIHNLRAVARILPKGAFFKDM